MPPARSFLDALPIVVMGVVLVVWVLFFRVRKRRDARALRPTPRQELIGRPSGTGAAARVEGGPRRDLLNMDLEPVIKRLFLWISPTLRVEVATGVSAVGFYLLFRSGLHAGIWGILSRAIAQDDYLTAGFFAALLLVPGAGLVLPPISLVVTQLRGKARGVVALSSSAVLMVSLLWSAIAYGRLAAEGESAFGAQAYVVLCFVAALETLLVLIGSLMLIKDRALLERLFPESRVDPRLVCVNLAVVAALIVLDETTEALGPATVAMASLNLCGLSAAVMPEMRKPRAEEPAVFGVPSVMTDDPYVATRGPTGGDKPGSGPGVVP